MQLQDGGWNSVASPAPRANQAPALTARHLRRGRAKLAPAQSLHGRHVVEGQRGSFVDFEKPMICRVVWCDGMIAHRSKQGYLAAVDCWQRDAMLCNGPLMFIDFLCIRQVKILIHVNPYVCMPCPCLTHVPELFLLCLCELCEDGSETGIRSLQSEKLQQSGLCLVVAGSGLSAIFCTQCHELCFGHA